MGAFTPGLTVLAAAVSFAAMTRWCHLLIALLGTLLAAGCSTIGVHESKTMPLVDGWRETVGLPGKLSTRSEQVLRKADLEEVYRENPREAARRLHELALKDSKLDYLFTLAEVHFLEGQGCETWHRHKAVMHYYLCAGYAYYYLFSTADENQPLLRADLKVVSHFPRLAPADAFDPRFRLACDLYNAGVARCLALAQKTGRLDPRCEMHIHTRKGEGQPLAVVHRGFKWQPEEFGKFLFARDYSVDGLENHYETYGLGVPLIVLRANVPPHPQCVRYPKEVCFPATAFIRFEGGLAELGQRHLGRLELYNPLAVQTAEVCGRSVPLQSDLTTPLAYMLSGADLDTAAYLGFLRPQRLEKYKGIYMIEPYQPGKIPVLMVHGLLSSPSTWAPAFNDLLADPVLRDRYQFWFFFYPTANPYLTSAADLRQALYELRQGLDPQEKDAAFDQMVLVGHSMGGLISRLLTVDSGDDFWHQVSNKPIDEVHVSAATRAELKRTFYFQRVPYVRTVVFLATPHRGSKISPSPLGRLGAYLVRLPHGLMTVAKDIGKVEKDFLPEVGSKRIPTSVDLLDPASPTLQLVANKPDPPGVVYHSIVGVLPPDKEKTGRFLFGTLDERGDGVVAYSSAHRDDAVSELIVPADHVKVHHHPLAVLEVRKILLEHLKAQPGPQPAVFEAPR